MDAPITTDDDHLPATGKMCRVTDAPEDDSSRPTPSRWRPGLSRRSVLRGGLALGAGSVLVVAASGCDSGPTPNQVTAAALVPLAQAALTDSAAARALAPRTAEYSAALLVVADQRDEHAKAFRDEITRLDQDAAARIASAATTSAAPGSTTASPTPNTAGTIDDLRDSLRTSAAGARDAALHLSGYSAGLCGSVSAAVTTLTEVQLG